MKVAIKDPEYLNRVGVIRIMLMLRTYAIESSKNLSTWKSVSIHLLSTNAAEIVLPRAEKQSSIVPAWKP